MSPGRRDALLLRPLLDVVRGLDRALAGRSRNLLPVALGLLAGWWLYVPVHELLHVVGCVVAGGEVSRLELSPLYGGSLLARWLPFVVAGGDYAGRLSGFDTHGSDLVYLATTAAPYLLTLFPGVWLLRRAGTAARPLAFGFALPLALAPFVALAGDAYELGSVVTTTLPPWRAESVRAMLRGDDLVRVLAAVRRAADPPWVGLGVAALLGALWALVTYLAGAGIAYLLGARPVPPAVAFAEGRRRRRPVSAAGGRSS